MNDNQTLVGAMSQYGNSVRHYDDGFGDLWLYRDASGYEMLVRAKGFESALEVVYDEMTPISAADLPEAYGFWLRRLGSGRYGVCYDSYPRKTLSRTFDTREDAADYALRVASRLNLDLVEGYQYQSNSTGTGIVAIDLNGESLEPFEPGMGGVCAIIETEEYD